MHRLVTQPYSAATSVKTGKTAVLPEFCRIECSDGSGGTKVISPPLWRSCLPKIYHGGPAHTLALLF